MPLSPTLVLSILASLFLGTGLVLLARRHKNYSHIRNTISELGEWGSPDQSLVALGFFLPIGLTTALVGYLLYGLAPAVAGLAFCISTGYVGAAMFPCDPGSPVTGSVRQSLHNLAGAVQYIGGGFALNSMSALGTPFKLASAFVFGCAVALTLLPATSVRGVVQRAAEICLFGSLAVGTYYCG